MRLLTWWWRHLASAFWQVKANAAITAATIASLLFMLDLPGGNADLRPSFVGCFAGQVERPGGAVSGYSQGDGTACVNPASTSAQPPAAAETVVQMADLQTLFFLRRAQLTFPFTIVVPV